MTYNAEKTVIQETTKPPTEALHKGTGLLGEHQLQEKKLDVSCSFIVDNIQKFIYAWKEITTDKAILEIAKKNLKINIVSDSKNYFISNIPYHPEEVKLITCQSNSLLQTAVIIECEREQDD